MITINTESLAETVDAVNDAFFYELVLAESKRRDVARWIAEMGGKPGSYAGMFAPTSIDRTNGVKVFTGEMIRSGAGVGHVLGEEACRVLILLGVADTTVKDALDRATEGMLGRLTQTENAGNVHGLYCCGLCSLAYWRHVMVGGLDRNEERLAAAMKAFRAHHTGDGHWRRLPFHYTRLAHSELDIKPAVDEMRYAAPVLDRYVRRSARDGKFSERRRVIAERVLAKC